MRELSKTRIGCIGAVVISGQLLVAGALSAKPPEHSRAGGIPACEEELAACDDDLGTCEANLVECEAAQVVLPGDGENGAPLAYEVCADGLTVADLNTGLLWERKLPGGAGCLADLHLVNANCFWVDATGAWINAVNAEGGTGYAGFNDWRLPNVKELHSIVHYGTFNRAIDPAFPGATALVYWTATSYALDPREAWFVGFSDGTVFHVHKGNGHRVRAVRNGSCSPP